MQITLIQPAQPHRGDQVYLPGGLLNLAARLRVAGHRVHILDLNLDRLQDHLEQIFASDMLGITLLGKPYIPGVLKLIADLEGLRFSGRIVLGGQGVERMEPSRFRNLFGSHAEAPAALDALGLPARYEVGIGGELARLHESRRRAYLTSEFALWLSDGCSQECTFCDAEKGVRERYRDQGGLRLEVEYICSELARWGHSRLEVYLTNLDAFQTPRMLEASMEIVHQVAEAHGIEVRARCLSTIAFFNKAVRRDPDLLGQLVKYGLGNVGFGADGADPRVWERLNKRHNTLEGLHGAIEACLQAGIDTDLLMVIGFDKDDAHAMANALHSSFYYVRRGASIRPYVGKPIVQNMTDAEFAWYAEDPKRFLSLDYAALASRGTHPKRTQRWMANAAYLALIGSLTPFGRNTTFPIIPLEGGSVRRRVARTINRFMPFDR